MKLPPLIFSFFVLTAFTVALILGQGCAQIGIPTGGLKDTLPPVLIKASPASGSRNVYNNKITLEFNEYIDVADLSQNLLISPLQNRNPSIIANPRTITLKFRDSLLPNTTYNINFGNAIRDINENNILKNYTYVFSTGSTLDSLSLNGKVTLAETGEIDSTLIVMLYRNAEDSSVIKKKPNYIAKVNSDGSFSFTNLPAANFKIYALKDGDGGKTYNSSAEIFAFTDEDVSTENTEDVILYAYAETAEASGPNTGTGIIRKGAEKRLRFSSNIVGSKDLLTPLELTFTNPLKNYDTNKISIADTNFNKIKGLTYNLDSTRSKLNITTTWIPDMAFILLIAKDAVLDSADNILAKSDTIRFTTKRNEDYGKLVIRFNNIDLSKNPVLQFVEGTTVKYAFPITSSQFTNNRFPPGEYGVRILYDKDKNGSWTPGNYLKKQQPELVVALPQKLSVKADWDNEREINL